MSATYPTGQPRIVYGRQAYIPEWQTPLEESDLARQVTQNGERLGFRIGEMLPERQWCVDAKTGELLAERDFEKLWERYVSHHVPVGVDKVVNIKAVNPYFEHQLAPVPTVRNFASRGLDWQGKEVEIGFDPDKPSTAREEDVRVYDSRGEEVIGASAAARPIDIARKLETLTDLKNRGRLTDSEYAEEVSALVSGDAAVPAVESIPQGFAPAVSCEAATVELTARCGKVCGSKAGRMAHERNCNACNPVTAEEFA
jgi:hypothetical protein